jgi:SPP1 gp7 family putative phage head morphogenesis protein
MKYTEKQINNLLEGIYAGDIDVNSLPKDLYNAISKYLIKGLDNIEGKLSNTLKGQLSDNLRWFAGAKTYHFVKDVELIKENEELKTFKEFKDEALQIYDQYNVNWLKTEYSTTIGQAQMCERWEQIEQQKEQLPFLRYSAVIDTQTSEICLPLDGITLPVDDNFWDSNSPLNHFNCRCTLEQVDEFHAVLTDKNKADEVSKEMEEQRQPLFNSNPYKTKDIFDKEHPYFDLDKDGAIAVSKLVEDGE